ncbi:MAG: hypothetical protein EOO89_30720, partial [Pedobacter sp.]
LEKEQVVGYKTMLSRTPLTSSHYQTLDKVKGLLTTLIAEDNITCSNLADCYLITNATLKQNIINVNLGGGAIQFTDPSTGLPAEQSGDTDSEGLPTSSGAGYDPDFDYISNMVECLGLERGLTEYFYKNYSNPGAGSSPTPFETGGSLFKVSNRLVADMNWGTGEPYKGVGVDNFGTRLKGRIKIPVSGSYTFKIYSDDGAILKIGNTTVVNYWYDHDNASPVSGTISLDAGYKDITLDYYEHGGFASVKLLWTRPGGVEEVVPFNFLYPIGSECKEYTSVVVGTNPSGPVPNAGSGINPLYVQIPLQTYSTPLTTVQEEEIKVLVKKFICVKTYFTDEVYQKLNQPLTLHNELLTSNIQDAIAKTCECIQDLLTPVPD